MQAGASRIDITPPEGVPMAGYLARTKGAEEVHDPLFARAIVLADGDCRVAIVGADLCAIDVETARSVRQRIAERTGMPADHVLLALTHTHAGPLVATRRISEVSAAYLEQTQDRVVEAAVQAAGRLVPCRVGAGRVKVYLGMNRRQRAKGGAIVLGKNPDGYYSPYSHVLVVAKEHGGPLGVLFTYGAHPVVLGPENLEISGDYAGVAERIVEENYGDEAIALFALGFAANVNVNFDKRGFNEVEIFGDALGRAVLEEIKDIEYVTDPALGVVSRTVPLPLEPPPPRQEAQRILSEERAKLSNLFGRGQDDAEIHRRRMMVEWASELLRVASEGRDAYVTDLELQAITIGRSALLALSAEVFAEYAEELDELSPFEHTFSISNANGDIGYLPTAAAFEEGGYEVDEAPRLLGALRFQPVIEGIVREAIGSLLAEAAGVPPEEPQPAEEAAEGAADPAHSEAPPGAG